jgi:hypothetical protein
VVFIPIALVLLTFASPRPNEADLFDEAEEQQRLDTLAAAAAAAATADSKDQHGILGIRGIQIEDDDDDDDDDDGDNVDEQQLDESLEDASSSSSSSLSMSTSEENNYEIQLAVVPGTRSQETDELMMMEDSASELDDSIVSSTALQQQQQQQQHQQQAVRRATSTCFQRWSPFRDISIDDTAIVLLVGAVLFLDVGAEVPAGGFMYSSAVKLELASELHASFINSAFWGALALGRLAAIPISMCATPDAMNTVNVIGTVFAAVLCLFSAQSVTMLWIGAICFGLCMASIFPTAIVLSEKYLSGVSGKAASLIVVGASFGEMLVPLLTSLSFGLVGIRALFPALIIVTASSVLVHFALLRKGGRIAELRSGFVSVHTHVGNGGHDDDATELDEYDQDLNVIAHNVAFEIEDDHNHYDDDDDDDGDLTDQSVYLDDIINEEIN